MIHSENSLRHSIKDAFKPAMKRPVTYARSFVLLSLLLYGQATHAVMPKWQSDLYTGIVSVSASGAVVAGPDNHQFSLGGNGTVEITSESISFSVAEAYDLLLANTVEDGREVFSILVKRPQSLVPSDLSGEWILRTFRIEDGPEGTEFHVASSTVGFTSDGAYLSNEKTAETFEIDSRNHVVASVGETRLDFSPAAGGDLMLADFSGPGHNVLAILTRLESGGNRAQLEGSWALATIGANTNILESERWSESIPLEIPSSGSFQGGDSPASLSPDGNGHVAWNQDGESSNLLWAKRRDLLVYVHSSEFEHELALLARKPQTLGLADLAGDWDLFELELSDGDVVETYYPGGAIQRRENYEEGELHGYPAISEWDPDGNLMLWESWEFGTILESNSQTKNGEITLSTSKSTYTEGYLTRFESIDYTADGIGLSYTIVSTYASDGSLLSEIEIGYHPDGETIAFRYITNQTEEGLRGSQETFTDVGIKTLHALYLDGQRDGLRETWRPDGRKWIASFYARGTLLKRIYWHQYPDGQTSAEEIHIYAGGVDTMLRTYWNENGTLSGVDRWVNGSRHGVQESYDGNGNQTETRTYRDGIEHGLVRSWFEGGAVLGWEATYVDGELHGPLTLWYEDGRVSGTEEYQNGVKHGEFRSYRYDLSDGWSSEDFDIWEYGEKRRAERWYDDAIGTLRAHWLDTSEAGNLNDNATPDYRLRESFDDQGRPTYAWEGRNGAADGFDRAWQEGVLTREDYYKEGKIHGPSRRYSPASGDIISDEYYQNGLLHGPYKYYHEPESGEGLREEGEYALGLREGVVKSYDSDGTTSATYLNDILHGPYSSPSESGTYDNGVKDGLWNFYSEGQLSQKIEYSKDSPHGISESYSEGQLSSRDRYSNGLRDGLQESFNGDILLDDTTYDLGVEIGPQREYHPNGQLARNTPLLGGLPSGTETHYHGNGVKSATFTLVAGVPHGSHRSWDSLGRSTGSGSYFNGTRCGTWTSTSYDDEGNAESSSTDYGSCSGTEDFRVTSGIKGVVTVDGIGVAGVALYLGDSDPYTQTGKDGAFFLEIGDYSDSTDLTLSHSNFPEKTVTISLPNDYTYPTQNFTLGKYGSPSLDLGDPSMAGTYFLKDVSFPIYFQNFQRPGGTDNNSPLIWLKPDGREFPFPYDFTLDPGHDVTNAGDAGQLFTRSAAGVESDKINLPTYNITQNPTWIEKLGKWETYWEGYANEPGSYLLIKKWPKNPLSIGVSRATVDPYSWALWSLIPVLGEGDLGIFDAQAILDMEATTDGKSEAYLSGGGTLKFWKTESRLKFLGDAKLAWNDTLQLSQAKLLIEAEIDFSEDATLLTLFPPIIDEGIGKYVGKLNDLIKLSVIVGGGISSNANVAPVNGELGFLPSDVKLSLLVGAEFKSIWLNPKDFEASFKGSVSGLWGLENESADFKDLDSKLNATLKWTIWDIVVVDISENYSTEPESQSETSQSLITPHFVQPDFLTRSTYSEFHPQDIIQTHSSSAETSTLSEGDTPLITNIYPYANPSVATNGTQTALAYVHYDPAQPEGQSTRLYYAIDSGNGFSTPQALHSQARSDFNPQLAYLPDGRLIAAWETSQLDQVASGIEDRVSGLEIAWSVYDSNNDTWSAPALLTSNNHLDHKPVLASSPNGLALAWQSNTANPIIPDPTTPDSLKFATWDTNAFATPSSLPFPTPVLGKASFAYDGTSAAIAWTQDMDDNLATSDDTELIYTTFDGQNWTSPVPLTSDSSPDSKPKLFCLEGGNIELIWIKDDQLVRMDNWTTLTHETLRDSESKGAPSNYQATCNAAGNIALLWTEFDDEQTDLFYALYDPNVSTWSDRIQISDNANIEQAPTFALATDATLTAAYLSKDPQSEQRDLIITSQTSGIDLTITAIEIEHASESENQYRVTLSLQNLANLKASSVTVDLHLGDPTQNGELLGSSTITLAGGATSEIAIETTTLTANATGTIYARIDPSDTILETDETNNQLTSDLHPVALEASYFTWNRTVSDETTLTLVGTITNNSEKEQSNIPIQISDESGVLYETTLNTLAAGESADITTTLDTLSGTEYRFTLSVDPTETLNEPDRSDNERTLLLSLRHLKDGDGDGMENAWEQLHFGTLDRDGQGDLDGDKLTDRFEFLTLNDPLDEHSKFPFAITQHPTDPDKVLISFPSTTGRIYRIQRTSDFKTWTNDSFHRGSGETLSVSATARGPGRQFNGFRVSVSLD